MFSIPTLRGTVFFMAAWSAFFALAIATAGINVAAIVCGGLLGAFAGAMESQALRGLPTELSNASADFQLRRKAFLATWPGKLFLGAEVLCGLLMLAVAFQQQTAAWLALLAAFGLARHSLLLMTHVLPSQTAGSKLA
ncbi:hypothetical protein [Paucibacter sp. Y2R2-4]|uniref:hypothetical protein n=1 Tax=Paucibacter sp. Y2R2-4 TaxID=2893553 RepID=UPI0021E431EC|nr:hypothetical protein [Paucibacter sp. Y2R2-4]MCV2352017.1 hypothetical protein [Paucibacter sp. Y2R2-4]